MHKVTYVLYQTGIFLKIVMWDSSYIWINRVLLLHEHKSKVHDVITSLTLTVTRIQTCELQHLLQSQWPINKTTKLI
jgi:hypothetical protein